MALYARNRTGRGQTVETRMILSNAYALSEHFVDDGRPHPRVLPDDGLHGLHALYRLYETAAGWVFVAAPDDRAFARLAAALGRSRLVDDPRFADAASRALNDDALVAELADVLAQRPAATWETELAGSGIGCVEVADRLYAGYMFESSWAEPLGFVEMSSAEGLGPYPRYGRFVRTGHDAELGPPERRVTLVPRPAASWPSWATSMTRWPSLPPAGWSASTRRRAAHERRAAARP